MNREIKFRGKNSFLEKWIYAEIQLSGLELFDYAVKEDTIGQFTGLYDKNGKEIYEGDIVQWEECVADYTFVTQKSEVFYSENSASFEPLNEFSYCNFEVIGNIYDNPELLEE